MPTNEEIMAADKRVQIILEALKKAPGSDPGNLAAELRKATEEYARLTRESMLKAG
jgi:hypothetical protein